MIVALAVVGFAFAQTTHAYTQTVTLKMGSTGSQVMSLQQALNANGYVVSTTGAGSPGMESTFFGAKTKAAVMAFQSAHGLTADGVVGPMTGAALSALTGSMSNLPAGCTSASGFSTTTGMPCNSGSSSLPAGCTSTAGYSPTTGAKCDGSTGGSSGSLTNLGETSISGLDIKDADDDSINEEASKAPVADIQFDVDDADAQLIRADVVFQLKDGNTGEEKPWRAFDKVYLMDGSTVIASTDASSSDAWDKTDSIVGSSPDNQAYRIRLNGFSKVYKKDSNNNDLWVAVDVASSVDGTDTNDENWAVGVDTDGLRFTDSTGLDTEVDTSDTASFSVEKAGAQSEFTVTEADNSPDAQTLKVNESSTSTQTIAIFKVKADPDGGDVKIDDFPITLTAGGTGSPDLSDFVDDVQVVLNGTTYSTDDSIPATTSHTFHFSDIEDDDVVVNAGDNTTVTVKVKFLSQGNNASVYPNGVTIEADADVTSSDVEDADTGDDIGDVNGTASGDTMTLAGNGISVDVNSATTDILSNDGSNNDTATFTWKIDVTAFGDNDVYINKDAGDVVQTDGSNNVDTIYTIQKSGGAALTATSGTITTTSSANSVTGVGGIFSGESFYKIGSGDTESFTITVTGTNQTDSKLVQAILSNIEFTTANVTASTSFTSADVQSYTANLSDDSQTGYKSIN